MTLPAYPRTIYARNQLRQVICQVKFPRLLRIEAEPAAAFQERIRSEYPEYAERSPEEAVAALQLPFPLPASTREELALRKEMRFATEDGAWTVALGGDFLALTATAYTRWEEFRRRFLIC